MAALLALLAGSAAAQPGAAPHASTPVVLVSVDGLKPEYVRDADRLGLRIPMRDVAPTLAARLGVALPAAEGRDLLGPAAGRATAAEGRR